MGEVMEPMSCNNSKFDTKAKIFTMGHGSKILHVRAKM